MLHKTRGIVLGHINYKETSIIARIYTEEFGLRSYIVNGAKGSRKSNKMAYFQVLSILNMVVYENEKKDIQRISEMKLDYPFQSIPFHHTKSIIALFISELLQKCLREESANLKKFSFLIDEIRHFDEMKEAIEEFHILFMLKLAYFLGFAPSSANDFEHAEIRRKPGVEKLIRQLLESHQLPKNGYERSLVLEALIQYYQYHIDNFGIFKSIKVLRDVVHN
jgi:DNA repair protein RecO (recombination protein O)